MPNVCPMHIELAGPPATLERLLEAWNAADGPLDDPNLLAALDPLPDGADPTDHWGDKWGAAESQVVAVGPMRVVVVATPSMVDSQAAELSVVRAAALASAGVRSRSESWGRCSL